MKMGIGRIQNIFYFYNLYFYKRYISLQEKVRVQTLYQIDFNPALFKKVAGLCKK